MDICRYRWLERERLGAEPGVDPCGECAACTATQQTPADDDTQPAEQPARPPRAPGGRRSST